VPVDSRAANERDGQWMKKMLTDENLAKVEELMGVAEGLGMTVARLALAWCLRREELASCIVGATKTSQVLENLKAGDDELDDATLDRIKMIFGE